MNLSEVYKSIAEASVNLGDGWPDADKFRSMLDVTPDGKFVATHFPDDDGPLGVFALMTQNEDATCILRQGTECFDHFCKELTELSSQQGSVDNNEGDDKLLNYVLRQSPESLHISICIFQEHPKLLKDGLPPDWSAIGQPEVASLLTALSNEQSRFPPPTLRLDRILWTPDGALIAGFVEENGTHYSRIKDSCQSCGKQVLKETQPTRVKNLIHVTLGRIVGLPSRWNLLQRTNVSEMVQKYNQSVLPDLVEKIRSRQEYKYGKFRMEGATLLRNRRWLLEENIIYGSWTFAPSSALEK